MGEDLMLHNQLFVGDCRNILALLRENPAYRFDVVFADPPYNLSGNGLKWKNKKGGGDWYMVNERWDQFETESYGDFTRNWVKQAFRLLKPTGTLFVCCTYHNIGEVMTALHEAGGKCLNLITWQKSNPVPNMTRRTLTHSCEYIAWFAHGKGWTYNYEMMKEESDAGGKQLRDLWKFPVCQGAERIKGPDRRAAHPTQKPLALVRRALRASARPGYSVLDPFMGSGTTAAAAHELGLRWVGIEKEESYVRIIRERMNSRGAEFVVSPRPTLMDIIEETARHPSLQEAEAQLRPQPQARSRRLYRRRGGE
jgi:site-specific DNA-methyltransferase (adenine-specific)/modification methylase